MLVLICSCLGLWCDASLHLYRFMYGAVVRCLPALSYVHVRGCSAMPPCTCNHMFACSSVYHEAYTYRLRLTVSPRISQTTCILDPGKTYHRKVHELWRLKSFELPENIRNGVLHGTLRIMGDEVLGNLMVTGKLRFLSFVRF